MFNFLPKKWLFSALCFGLIAFPVYAQNNNSVTDELNVKIDAINIYISDFIFIIRPMSISADRGVKQTITTYFDNKNNIRSKEIIDYDKQGLIVKVNSQMILFAPEYAITDNYMVVSREKDQILLKYAPMKQFNKTDCFQYDKDNFCLKFNEDIFDFSQNTTITPLTSQGVIDCESLRKNTKYDCILDEHGRVIEKYPASIPFFLRYNYDSQGRISRTDFMVKDPKEYFAKGYQPTERDIYKFIRKWEYTQGGYLFKEYRLGDSDSYIYEYGDFDKKGLWTTGTLTINDMFSSSFKRDISYY